VTAFVVGTAGHVDHGKTTLVRALTGVDTDRWREEKERGLTIDLGFARLPVEGVGDREVGVVDVPGHEDFVKNMLAGATGIDLLLLVVAADEGPMPQTREHLTIARLLGVREGVVALTKVDRVEEGWTELATDAVREELEAVLGHAEWPVVPVSAPEGIGLDRLREELAARAEALPPRYEDDLFRLPVDRSFTVRGAGTVITGTTWSGRVAVGDRVRLLPGGPEARVRTLQVHGEDRGEVGAGRRCALAIVGVEADAVSRGSTAVTGPGWRAVERVGVRLTIPSCLERPIEDGQRVRAYLGTREVMARVDLDRELLLPGESGWARLRLEAPLVARGRDRLVIRFYSPVTTLGGGEVAEPDPPGAWTERTGGWETILDGAPLRALGAAVSLAGGGGLALDDAPFVTGLTPDEVRAAADAADLLEVDGRWFSAEAADACRSTLLEELAGLHRAERRAPAASLASLRRTAESRGFADALVDRSLQELALGEEVVIEGPGIRLPGHVPELTGPEEEALATLRRLVAGGGLEPPMVDDLAGEVDVGDAALHDLLDLLVGSGDLVSVTPDLYVSPESERELRERALRVLERTTPASASDFKDALNVTRRYLIPYLERLDGLGVTRRTPEGRFPGPAAMD